MPVPLISIAIGALAGGDAKKPKKVKAVSEYKTGLSAFSLVFITLSLATGQQVAPMTVSVDFQGAPDAAKKSIEKYVADGFESRGIHKISDYALDPRGHLFDDYGWIVIKQVGDAVSKSYALEIQLSVVEGASANNMLLRFRGSLTHAVVVKNGATEQEINSVFDKVLFAALDKLMDEAKQEFGSPSYRHGWHPIPAPHPAAY